jgi:hypothetical protein
MSDINPPKGITIQFIYEPDMERMVEALRILLFSRSEKTEKEDEQTMKEVVGSNQQQRTMEPRQIERQG